MKFKIADIVTIKDLDGVYTYYKDWFLKYCPRLLQRYKVGDMPSDDCVYEIIAMGEKCSGIMLYAISEVNSKDTPIYLIEEKYLEAKNKLVMVEEQECIYTRYAEWFVKYNPILGIRYAYSRKDIPTDCMYEVVVEGPHLRDNHMLYAIRKAFDENEPIFLINAKGTKPVY